MKILSRTLAILAAALVVVGITFTFAQSSYAQNLFPARPEQAAVQAQAGGSMSSDSAAAGASTTTSQGASAGGPDHESSQSPSLFGAIQVIQNLVVVGVIVGIVSLVTWVGRRRGITGGRRPQAAP